MDTDADNVSSAAGVVDRERRLGLVFYRLKWGGSPMLPRFSVGMPDSLWLPSTKLVRSRRGCGLMEEYEQQVAVARFAGRPPRLPGPPH